MQGRREGRRRFEPPHEKAVAGSWESRGRFEPPHLLTRRLWQVRGKAVEGSWEVHGSFVWQKAMEGPALGQAHAYFSTVPGDRGRSLDIMGDGGRWWVMMGDDGAARGRTSASRRRRRP